MFDTQAVTFHKVLEMVEMLPEEEQETLLDIIQHRLSERGLFSSLNRNCDENIERERIVQNVMKARAEYTKGEVRQGTVEDLMREMDVGMANALRFMGQFEVGQGDYTKERDALLEGETVEQISEKIRASRRPNENV